jgi:quinohemoprotein amine dehydrogenase alpha subunit
LAIVAFLSIFLIHPHVQAQTFFPEDSLVWQRCSACHEPDEKGRMEVLEETRKSPEEWKVVVDRMIRLNDTPVEDAEFNPIIKELSKHLCLTPGEMAEVSYFNSDENSQYRETASGDLEERLFVACVRCHTYGKIKSHRNTLQQWAEIRNLHLGYYPTAVMQMREMDWAQEFQDLLDPLTQLFPFEHPKWRDWLRDREEQDLTGQWQVAGYQPGLGYYGGTYSFVPNVDKGDDEYLIEREVRYANGLVLKTAGEGTLYSEYHLRYTLAPTPLTGRVEGVFDLDTATTGFTGKWWTLVQDSNAFGNEEFYKKDAPPRIFAIFPMALRATSGVTQHLQLIGVGLPSQLGATDIAFSDPNVRIAAIESAGPSAISLSLEVGADTATGPLHVNVRDIPVDVTMTVFDKIDGIKIFPALGRARISSGAAYPPQGVQFVARGVAFGPDGKQGTLDDLYLEPLPARWWLEEEPTRDDDDDLQYLRAPVVNGLYTPVTDYGPIPTRFQSREGVGLIAVGAAFAENGRELKDRVLLAVTSPDFVPHIK